MALASSSFPILALPLELRLRIYEELLAPNPAIVHTLYHDRRGRDRSFNIHPSILRVNTQIHDEAVAVLYDHNTFMLDLSTAVVSQCTGGSYPDRIRGPQPLFRDDAEPTTAQGLIYPHCLKRLRNIDLLTSPSAVWGSAQLGSHGSAQLGTFFSHIGNLILSVLRLLAYEEATMESMKRLRFTFVLGRFGPGGRGWCGRLLYLFGGRGGEEDGRAKRKKTQRVEEMEEIVSLLRAMGKVRRIETFEQDCADDAGVLHEVDLGTSDGTEK
ncbi:hypothetical protein MMC08_004186 [Hypocenomyce scalaris]|nr:hypothetical protein [Hypocenomyce scalaris]